MSGADQYYGKDLVEMLKSLSAEQVNQLLVGATGTVTSVDPVAYAAKVQIGALGIETGWLPIGTIYAGPGFGFWALPLPGADVQPGTEVTVLFEFGNINAGKIILSNFNAIDTPPPGLQPGEVALAHQSGSLLRFHNNGDVDLAPAGNLILCGGGPAVARVGDYIEAASGTYTDPHGVQHTITGRVCSGSSKSQSG